MVNQFVPYELEVKLKELGCDRKFYNGFANGILWQQAFDWFREKYNLDSYVRKVTYKKWKLEINYILQNDSKEEWEKYKKFQDYKDTQEEARQACLEKLIEIWKKK